MSTKPSFTKKESLRILDEALRLLATPAQWTTGYWKCKIIDPKTGDQRVNPKTGEKMYSYCIEGAVNQAIVNTLGVSRAYDAGVVLSLASELPPEPAAVTNEQLDSSAGVKLLSIDDLTDELYGAEGSCLSPKSIKDHELSRNVAYAQRKAQVLNDRGKSYEKVMHVLRTKRGQIVRSLKRAA